MRVSDFMPRVQVAALEKPSPRLTYRAARREAAKAAYRRQGRPPVTADPPPKPRRARRLPVPSNAVLAFAAGTLANIARRGR